MQHRALVRWTVSCADSRHGRTMGGATKQKQKQKQQQQQQQQRRHRQQQVHMKDCKRDNGFGDTAGLAESERARKARAKRQFYQQARSLQQKNTDASSGSVRATHVKEVSAEATPHKRTSDTGVPNRRRTKVEQRQRSTQARRD